MYKGQENSSPWPLREQYQANSRIVNGLSSSGIVLNQWTFFFLFKKKGCGSWNNTYATWGRGGGRGRETCPWSGYIWASLDHLEPGGSWRWLGERVWREGALLAPGQKSLNFSASLLTSQKIYSLQPTFIEQLFCLVGDLTKGWITETVSGIS